MIINGIDTKIAIEDFVNKLKVIDSADNRVTLLVASIDFSKQPSYKCL